LLGRRRHSGTLACAAVAAAALTLAVQAAGSRSNWAAPEIRAVTQAGVLGTSPATFRPDAPLTQGALADAISTTDTVQHRTVPVPPAAPLVILSTVADGVVVGGLVDWEIEAPGQTVDRVDFAIDGAGLVTARTEPYRFDVGAGGLDTGTLADGTHQLAVNVHLAGGGYALAVWNVTVANAPGAVLTGPGSPVAVPIARSWQPPAASRPATETAHALYHAVAPTRPVSVKQLDASLVAYLGLGGAAREIQATLQRAGLEPRPNTGTEAVARMLGLRLNHPAGEDWLELLPFQPATRAEAAWSFARVLHLDDWSVQDAQHAADTFTLPELTPWQRRILTTAVAYVGYPYVWGGTSPTTEVEFGVRSTGGFDCSGFVWRVYKLTPYPDEAGLAGVLRGRTTYQMSGEVPRAKLVPLAKLQPADVMFFGAHGPRSSPNVVDHAALYLGNGWFIQSSGEGVTLLPFEGWYKQRFAWARRPLHEAGLE